MKDPIELREFDRITCNKDYECVEGFKCISEENFNALEGFVLASAEEGETEGLDFFRISSMKHVKKVIQVRNYVGLIQFNKGLQIEILPKITLDANSGDETLQTKRIFLKMMRCLKDFPCRVFNDTDLKVERLNLYEIFINMFIQEARNLVKVGLRSSYVAIENNLHVFKGKLIVKEHIGLNYVHKERFYVGYDEYSTDCAENRLIKSTLQKLLSISNSFENKKELMQLLSFFDLVNESKNYIKDFSKVIIDRNTKRYDALMRWSRVFLLNKSFSAFTGDNSARSLLFPMERLFEAYVAKHMRSVFADNNWTVSVQDRGYYLFDAPPKFSLRPDIVITRDDGSKILMDTKWKQLVDKPNKDYGISQADMYQMYAYAKKYSTQEIWLLYPATKELKHFLDIQYSSNDNVNVRVFFVDVANITESLELLKTQIPVYGI